MGLLTDHLEGLPAMGEITELVLNGDLCQACGEAMEGGDGYPRTCMDCQAQATTQEPDWNTLDEFLKSVEGTPIPLDVEARIRELLTARGQPNPSDTIIRFTAQLLKQHNNDWAALEVEMDALTAEAKRLTDQSFEP